MSALCSGQHCIWFNVILLKILKGSWRFWLLFLFIVSHLSPASAQDLYPSNIEVRLGQVGESFYSVVMDDYENPYLPVESFLIYVLELSGECEDGVCFFYLPHDSAREEPPFVINLGQKQCQRAESQPRKVDVVAYDGSWFIHWKHLKQCLPIDAKWFIDSYQLVVDQDYRSKSELEEEIQRIKRNSREKALQFDILNRQKPIEPLEHLGFATRLTTTIDWTRTAGENLYFLADSIAVSEHSQTKISIDSRNSNPIHYYHFLYDIDSKGARFEVGHVLFDGNVFSKSQSVENGLLYSNRPDVNQYGQYQLEKLTEPNISIDVLVNGIYQNTYQSDQFGRFRVEEKNIGPGDTVSFRYYLSEGVWQQEDITVAGLDGMFISKGNWGVDLMGEFEPSEAGSVVAEYGVRDNWTLGASTIKSGKEYLLGFQTRYLPTHWVAAEIGWLPELNYVPIEVELLFSQSQSLSLELYQRDKLERDTPNYHLLTYRSSNEYVNTRSQVRADDDSYQFESKIGGRLSPIHFWNYKLDATFRTESDSYNLYHGIEIAKSGFSDTSWNLMTNFEKDGTLDSILFGIRNKCSDCWFNQNGYVEQISSNASISYRNKKFKVAASMEVEVNQYTKVKVFIEQDEVGVAFTGEFGARSFVGEEGADFMQWGQYSYAKVIGKVKDQQGNSLANVGLRILEQRVSSDENGEFVFEKVPARKRLPLYIEEETLNLNLVPKQNPILLNTRRAGVTHANLVLVASFGIDGLIKGNLADNSYIHFKHIEKNLEYSSYVEPDGFYMVEGLVAGDYRIVLESGSTRRVLERHLDSDFWLSDLDFHVDEFH